MTSEAMPKDAITQDELEAEIKGTVEKSKSLVITNDDEFIEAQEFLKFAKTKAKKVKEWFKPMVKAAHEAHKEIKAKENEFLKPLEEVSTALSGKVGTYQAELEEKERKARAAKEKRLKEEAEKKQIEEAEELEAAGRTEEAEAKLEEPTDFAPPPVPEKPKVEGMSFRETWHFEIQNREQIPRDYMIPDEKKIGGIVRAAKNSIRIPGIRIYSKKTPVSR